MRSVILLILLATLTSAFYLSFNPVSFKDGEPIQLFVNKIFSEKTQLSFAYGELPFVCKPSGPVEHKPLNLGEVLRGDRIMLSNHKINMGESTSCTILCKTEELQPLELSFAKQLVSLEYKVEWIVDDLPAAIVRTFSVSNKKSKQYEMGFLLGSYDEQSDRAFINNHVHLKFMYETKDDVKFIVGFEAIAGSVDYGNEVCPNDLSKLPPLEVGEFSNKAEGGKSDTAVSKSITYTYSVSWHEETELKWGNRWDLYLTSQDPQIHWYSIINSLIILLFLTAMVAIIMLRTLNNDIAVYNEEDVKEEQEDTTGWKLLHGDVFRPPRLAGLLSALVGNGIQFSLMAFTIVVMAMLGVLNPAYRGGFVSSAIFAYMFMGVFAGYYSSRLYKSFKGTSWMKNAFVTCLLAPGVIFGTVFLLNFFIWYQGSSNAIPFGTFFALVSMWMGISTPLIFFGAYFGSKKQGMDQPVRTNQIPRQIPDQVWYLRPVASALLAGLIPFAVIFLELFFILKSLWQTDHYYYMFGFLGLVSFLLILTCIEMTIVIIYFTLSAESWRWHWRAFLISSSSALYIFIYSVIYYATKLDIEDSLSLVVYFSYSFLACFAYFCVTGTLGFLVCHLFVAKMYASIKID